MDQLSLNSEIALHGFRAVQIENRYLRVIVLPEAGARIWQITYKPLGLDLLWNNPYLRPARQPLHACYDDVWSGGWDELFPNDEAASLGSHALPDHGELWAGEWQAEPFLTAASAGVHLRFFTPISKFSVEKTLSLRPESARLEVQYRLTNQGADIFSFLFKLHPAFAVAANHRIDFPAMSVLLEPEFLGTMNGAPLTFHWPYATIGNKVVDLREIPDVSSHAVNFFYGTGLASGWCGITNRAARLAAVLRFDLKVFSSCWLFASHGGWRNLNVAVLEPATGYPFRMQPMIDCGQARRLAPGESLETAVLFSVQEGLTSIGGVEKDGRILPGKEI